MGDDVADGGPRGPSRTPQGPLHRHVRYATDQVSFAQQAGSSEMSPHHLRISTIGRFSARCHSVTLGSSNLFYFAYGDDVTVVPTRPLDYYSLQIPLTGKIDVSCDDRRIEVRPGNACVVSPADVGILHSVAGTSKVTVKLSRQIVARTLATISGHEQTSPVFSPLGPETQSWIDAVRLAVRSVDRCATGRPSADLGGHLETMIASTLLLSQPHSTTEQIRSTADGRAAMAALDAARVLGRDLTCTLTIGEVAALVGVSRRTLQTGFQAQFGCSPSSYLRDLRLAAAHRRLQSETSATSSVAEIAAETGNTHFGRFAQAYRARYGMPPSDTLRSTRL